MTFVSEHFSVYLVINDQWILHSSFYVVAVAALYIKWDIIIMRPYTSLVMCRKMQFVSDKNSTP